MPKASEIDDIFAGRTKSAAPPKAGPSTAKASTPALPSAAGTTLDGAIKKKKKPKSSAAAGVVGSVSEDVGPSAVVAANGSKKKLKRPAEPETVVDPSVPKPVTKRVKVVDDRPKPPPAAGGIGIAKPKPGAKRRVVGADDEQERAFRDSRGKEPRRKTEEGWNIYKEDELGIAGAGGNTPLCPFDCDCCF